jgi:CBS domain containing-hemolysin-like protein
MGGLVVFGSQLVILWALVNTGLFVAAATAALASVAVGHVAEHVAKDGWRSRARWTRRAAQVLTLFLTVVLFGTTLAMAVFFL